MKHEISAIPKVIFNEIKIKKTWYYLYFMALKHKPTNFCVAHPKKQQSSLNLEENDYVGYTESIVVSIRAFSYGNVRFNFYY